MIDSTFRTFLAEVGKARNPKESTRLALSLISEQFEFSVAILSEANKDTVATFGLSASAEDQSLKDILLGDATEVLIPGEGNCQVFKFDISGFVRKMVLTLARPKDLSVQDNVDLILFSRVLGLVCQSHWHLESERNLRLAQNREHRMLESILEVQRLISHKQPIDTIIKTLASQTKELLAAQSAGIELTSGGRVKITGVTGEDGSLWNIPTQVSEIVSKVIKLEKNIEQKITIEGKPSVVSAVPMFESQKVIGSMFAVWQEKNPKDNQIRSATDDLMSAFAGQASLALIDAKIEKALKNSYTDPLTGLANRNALLENVKESIESGNGTAFLYIDLNGFKNINDNYGHGVGDVLLQTVAKRIKNCIRIGDLAGRLGGDEFAVLLREIDNLDAAKELAGRLLGIVVQPVQINGIRITPTISIGISQTDDGEVDELVNSADMAMYSAKSSKDSSIMVSSQLKISPVHGKENIATSLVRSIEREELHCLYQPIYNIDGELSFFETLLRWDRPGIGLVSPDSFIPIAERTGFIEIIGEYVRKSAITQFAKWQKLSSIKLNLSVNISPKEFDQSDIQASIQKCLADSGLNPNDLIIEVTESLELSINGKTNLNRLKNFGVKIALDDIGKGFSNLSRIPEIKPDILKIGSYFFKDIATSRTSQVLVESIVFIGKEFQIPVVAEGIETIEQLNKVKSLGLTHIQGNYLGAPLTVEVINRILDSQQKFDTKAIQEFSDVSVRGILK